MNSNCSPFAISPNFACEMPAKVGGELWNQNIRVVNVSKLFLNLLNLRDRRPEFLPVERSEELHRIAEALCRDAHSVELHHAVGVIYIGFPGEKLCNAERDQSRRVYGNWRIGIDVERIAGCWHSGSVSSGRLDSGPKTRTRDRSE